MVERRAKEICGREKKRSRTEKREITIWRRKEKE